MSPLSLKVSLTSLDDPAQVASRWRKLEARSDSNSFFLGWTWTGSWLSATGARPDLLAIKRDGDDIALALLGRSVTRRPFGREPALFLNQSGQAGPDRAFIEYNGLLTIRGFPAERAAALVLDHLSGLDRWTVLRVPGVERGLPLAQAGDFRRRTLVSELPAYYVELDLVRQAGGDYLSLLSPNSRSQIRRSSRHYGEPRLEKAASIEEADTWLADMRRLNQERHRDNAWEEPLFRSFVRELVAQGLANGEVELLRIGTESQLLGYLLNFLYRGRAMNYQSAFAPSISAKAKPGLMCHCAAVERYAAQGYVLYSLLAGKDRYKQSLSTGHEVLQWWNLERFSPALEAEHVLRKVLKRPASA
ncbi:GNAT family N-acetyltransferase [Rhizorhapis sp.]|uniref:GNAT family N-acetyltransferase n=1 Tax=Rhizorhapis sp. TaxID=1968842 RepID=UPI002B4948D4|nr:GNAT family N-acetyltransferase [Rhizorhapis sp.]HKR17280.1 GNAT family N-acetyltransferase [Rhizorhapis sp.]